MAARSIVRHQRRVPGPGIESGSWGQQMQSIKLLSRDQKLIISHHLMLTEPFGYEDDLTSQNTIKQASYGFIKGRRKPHGKTSKHCLTQSEASVKSYGLVWLVKWPVKWSVTCVRTFLCVEVTHEDLSPPTDGQGGQKPSQGPSRPHTKLIQVRMSLCALCTVNIYCIDCIKGFSKIN